MGILVVDELMLREPALLMPQAIPLGNVRPRASLKPVSVWMPRPGKEYMDLCGFRWIAGGSPVFAFHTETATGALGAALPDVFNKETLYSLLCSSIANYLYSQHTPLRDLPLSSEFTVVTLSQQSAGGQANPAQCGWSGSDDIVFYKARNTWSNAAQIYWRDIGVLGLEPANCSNLYNWSLDTFVFRTTAGGVATQLYTNGVQHQTYSGSDVARGPFTQVEIGRWESQTMANISSIALFGAFARAWSPAEVAECARDPFVFLAEPA